MLKRMAQWMKDRKARKIAARAREAHAERVRYRTTIAASRFPEDDAGIDFVPVIIPTPEVSAPDPIPFVAGLGGSFAGGGASGSWDSSSSTDCGRTDTGSCDSGGGDSYGGSD